MTWQGQDPGVLPAALDSGTAASRDGAAVTNPAATAAAGILQGATAEARGVLQRVRSQAAVGDAQSFLQGARQPTSSSWRV